MISLIASYLPWEWIGGAIAALAAFAAVYMAGGKSARQKAKIDAQSGYISTRKKIDDADIHGNDPAALRDWLRERNTNKR